MEDEIEVAIVTASWQQLAVALLLPPPSLLPPSSSRVAGGPAKRRWRAGPQHPQQRSPSRGEQAMP